MEKDLYSVLGLESDATRDEIQAAYRRLVKEWHPDVKKGSSEDMEKFLEIQRAYEELSDEKKRRAYDIRKGYYFRKRQPESKEDTSPKRKGVTASRGGLVSEIKIPVIDESGTERELTIDEIIERNIKAAASVKEEKEDESTHEWVITYAGTDFQERVRRSREYVRYKSKAEEIPEKVRKKAEKKAAKRRKSASRRTKKRVVVNEWIGSSAREDRGGWGEHFQKSDTKPGIDIKESSSAEEIEDWDKIDEAKPDRIDNLLSQMKQMEAQIVSKKMNYRVFLRENLVKMLFWYYFFLLSGGVFLSQVNLFWDYSSFIYLLFWTPILLLHYAFSDEAVWGQERRGQPHSEEEYMRRKGEKFAAAVQFIILPSLFGVILGFFFALSFNSVFFLLFPFYMLGLISIYYSIQDERKYGGTYPTFFIPSDEKKDNLKSIRCPVCSLVAGYVPKDENPRRIFCPFCGEMRSLLLPVSGSGKRMSMERI